MTRADTRTANPPRPSKNSGADNRRPHLDGIRAVAVYLVVAFHADLRGWSGGFIGVDVFFVLSGYLITGLLVDEYRSTGTIALRQFYSRRVRRLLPASLVTIVVVAATMATFLSPLLIRSFVDDARSALLFVANWRFITTSTDYFANAAEESPFLHFWSLAVEEQFYAIWPLAVLCAMHIGRRMRWPWFTGAFVGAVFVGSISLALTWRETLGTRAYFGTDTRAYQLAAGALLALLLRSITPRDDRRWSAVAGWAAAAALGALMVLGTDLVDVASIERGVVVTAVVIVLLLAVDRVQDSTPARLLGAAPLPYLGRISYATYLWHWPIIVYAKAETDLSPVGLLLLSAIGATAIAAVSFVVIERPFRGLPGLGRRPGLVVLGGLSVVGLVALVAPTIVDATDSSRTDEALGEGIPPIAQIEDAIQRPPFALVGRTGCRVDDIEACTVTPGGDFHILLLGDSLSGQWQPALSKAAETEGFTVSAVADSSCMWELGLRLDPDVANAVGLERDARCLDQKDDWYETLIPALAPDLIFIQSRPRDPSDVLPADDALRDVDRDRLPEVAAERSIEALRRIAPVVVLEPLPLIPIDVPQCLVEATSSAECAFPVVENDFTDDTMDAMVDAGAVVVSPLPLICPGLDSCTAVIDGQVVFRDTLHISVQYAESIADDLVALLRDNQLLAG